MTELDPLVYDVLVEQLQAEDARADAERARYQ